MQKTLIRLVGTAAVMLFSSTTLADEVNGLIQDLAVQPGKNVEIKLYNSNSACGAISWHLNLTNPNNQDAYQNLLGAMASNKKIVLETENNCSGNIVNATIDESLELTKRGDYLPRFQWLSDKGPNLHNMQLTPLIEQYLIEQFGPSRTWDNITTEVFNCSKDYLEQSLKDAPNVKDIHIDDGFKGKISYTVTEPPFFKGKYGYNFDFVEPKLRVEITQKPQQVPNDSIWGTIDEGLAYCKGK